MKKVTVLLMCAIGLVALSSCKSCNRTKTTSAAEVARAQHERLMNQDYVGYVETIYLEEALPPAVVSQERARHAQILRNHVQPNVQSKGGVRHVTVKSERMAPDNRSAQVVLTSTYNNGDVEDIAYDMIMDGDAWKVKTGRDKEVWKAVSNGHEYTVKLKDNDYKDFVKVHEDGSSRDFVKDIETDRRDVHKEKVDGEKEVTKVIEKENEIVIKHKEDGEREVTRIPK
ncbi:MAG: hypothetical protein LUD68_09030 [Rikenellaceae bacterium]|nr:hypothetical protein [Rikenellaceae bacterium]